jgi:hypothetical protein
LGVHGLLHGTSTHTSLFGFEVGGCKFAQLHTRNNLQPRNLCLYCENRNTYTVAIAVRELKLNR